MDKIKRATEIYRTMTPHQMALRIVEMEDESVASIDAMNMAREVIDEGTAKLEEYNAKLDWYDKRITEIQDALDLAEEAVIANNSPYAVNMVPDTQSEFVGNLRQQLLTQDGRCTADPFFVVFSKREIVVDSEYDHDRIVWWHKEDNVEACERATRWLDYREDTCRDTGDWVKIAIKEIDQFETACLTEQGCKDYLAVNGHNLRKPFICAHSLFRNLEMLELRKMLMAAPNPQGGAA